MRRIYDEPASRGKAEHRVLVDRLWPRGVRKEEALIDEWAKDLAPSTELRRWYGHDPDKFSDFARKYRRELSHSHGASEVERLRALGRRSTVVLVTAAKDIDHSGAAVLRAVLVESPT